MIINMGNLYKFKNYWIIKNNYREGSAAWPDGR